MVNPLVPNSPLSFQAFTDEQWRAYQSICRKWPAPIDWDEARLKLEEACREFVAAEAEREASRRSEEYKCQLDGCISLFKAFQASSAKLRELSPSSDDLEGLPDLGPIGERLHDLRIQYETWTTPFSGRNNRNRETFDSRVLSIWEEHFHGRIRSSRGRASTPTGPLIRFLSLTYKLVLGKWAPGPSGIRGIIDRAKKKRRKRSRNRKAASVNLRQRQ